MEKRAQQPFIIGDEQSAHMSLGKQLVQIVGGEIGHGVGLGMRPDRLNRVEFRGVRGQKICAHTVAVRHEPSDNQFPDVGFQSVVRSIPAVAVGYCETAPARHCAGAS